MDGYIYEAELDERQKARVVAMSHAPGESVMLHPSVEGDRRGILERAVAANGGRLTVKTVILTADDKLNYEFEEVEGRFHHAYVTDVREMEHMYGALVHDGGKTWVVEFEGDDIDDPSPGRVRCLSGDPERYVAYNQGIRTEAELAAYAEDPDGVCGEFSIASKGDGPWALVAIPWSAPMSDRQIEVAREAVGSPTVGRPRLH
jgi:hypothetical protein